MNKKILTKQPIEVLGGVFTPEYIKITVLPDGRRAISFDEYSRIEQEAHNFIMDKHEKSKRRAYDKFRKRKSRELSLKRSSI